MAKKIGRPSLYSDELCEAVCVRIASGESLVAICADAGMPSYTTVQKWLRESESFAQSYARAREDQADVLAEEMLDVARGKSGDQVEAADKRLLLDTLKWRASKLRPRVYGDRQQIDQTVTGDVQHTVRVILTDD